MKAGTPLALYCQAHSSKRNYFKISSENNNYTVLVYGIQYTVLYMYVYTVHDILYSMYMCNNK